MSIHYPVQRRIPKADSLNQRLLQEFEACRESPDLRRSHLFEGRYENLYVTEEQMPGLRQVLDAVREEVAGLLGCDSGTIAVGYWLNAMYPGHVTLPHTHDDDDEALSGVYYICVPDHSGDLLLETEQGTVCLTPTAGEMVFFPPNLQHEVNRHQGVGLRLSLGMNFGLRSVENKSGEI